jgi:hypothetical protein
MRARLEGVMPRRKPLKRTTFTECVIASNVGALARITICAARHTFLKLKRGVSRKAVIAREDRVNRTPVRHAYRLYAAMETLWRVEVTTSNV